MNTRFFFLMTLATLFATGCCKSKANSFVSNIEAVVTNAEVNSENWSDQEWTLFESRLEGMMAGEYFEINGCLEVAQQSRITLAYDRGKDLLIKENPVEGLIDEIRNGINTLFE